MPPTTTEQLHRELHSAFRWLLMDWSGALGMCHFLAGLGSWHQLPAFVCLAWCHFSSSGPDSRWQRKLRSRPGPLKTTALCLVLALFTLAILAGKCDPAAAKGFAMLFLLWLGLLAWTSQTDWRFDFATANAAVLVASFLVTSMFWSVMLPSQLAAVAWSTVLVWSELLTLQAVLEPAAAPDPKRPMLEPAANPRPAAPARQQRPCHHENSSKRSCFMALMKGEPCQHKSGRDKPSPMDQLRAELRAQIRAYAESDQKEEEVKKTWKLECALVTMTSSPSSALRVMEQLKLDVICLVATNNGLDWDPILEWAHKHKYQGYSPTNRSQLLLLIKSSLRPTELCGRPLRVCGEQRYRDLCFVAAVAEEEEPPAYDDFFFYTDPGMIAAEAAIGWNEQQWHRQAYSEVPLPDTPHTHLYVSLFHRLQPPASRGVRDGSSE